MKNIKNISKVAIVTLIVLALFVSQAFALSATLTLEPNTKQVPLNGEFTVAVKANNITDEVGLTKVEAVLSYDENAIQPVTDANIQGANGWGIQYESATKKITASIRQGALKESGKEIFQITFKTKSSISSAAAPTVTGTNTSVSTTPSTVAPVSGSTTNTIAPTTGTTPVIGNANGGNTTPSSTATTPSTVAPVTGSTTNTIAPTTGTTPVIGNANGGNTTPSSTATTPSTVAPVTGSTPSAIAPVSGATSNTSSTSPVTATINLKQIKYSNGVQTVNGTDVSTSVTVGGNITKAPETKVTEPLKTTKEEPKKIPHTGIEDAPVVLLIALAGVAVISFIGYRRVSGK